MADKDSIATTPEEKPKITLRFNLAHEHRTGVFKDGEEVVKRYIPGDRDIFTQSDADLLRSLKVAQVILNPGPKASP
jgi:hypothetical protein